MSGYLPTWNFNRILRGIPIQQGLKPYAEYRALLAIADSEVHSTRTRIETPFATVVRCPHRQRQHLLPFLWRLSNSEVHSTRTRIETKGGHLACLNLEHIQKYIPPEQGLKHRQSSRPDPQATAIQKYIPPEQGLKQAHHSTGRRSD